MRKQWKQWQTLYSWTTKITVDGECSYEIERHLFLGRKDKPRQNIKKQRHHFANKGPYGQSFGFSIVMYGSESWTLKKAEHQKIDAFALWCWRTLLGVPWIARSSNQSILKGIIPEPSLEGLMLKLKLKYFGHLMQRSDSLERSWCWERSKAGGEGNDRGWDGWMTSLTQWTWVWANFRSEEHTSELQSP